MGYIGRPGIGLVRICQINLPYHTNINKSISSISVDNLIPLVGMVALANKTCRGKGGTYVHARVHLHALKIPRY